MRDKKKAIFRYERLSMCITVLFTIYMDVVFKYGVWPNPVLAEVCTFLGPIESLFSRIKVQFSAAAARPGGSPARPAA